MSRWRVVVVVLGLVACTKPNPRSCADGTCTDPEFPFCDVGGELEGTPQTCIAVACDPGVLQSCRGDQEVRCNAEGTDFDLIRCDLGCDDGVGCRLCEPNETACTNGTVATCDANGVVTESETCALGCFEDEPRCREIVPSNDLGSLLALSASAVDLDLSMGGTIDTTTGSISRTDNSEVALNTVLLQEPTDGVPIRVLIAHSVKLGNVQVVGTAALAIVSFEEVHIVGTVSLTRSAFGVPVPGLFSSTACNGKPRRSAFQVTSGNYTVVSGGGGGGHATAGGSGGLINGQVPGGAGGQASGGETLVPLRGGCSGSGGNDAGGAIQLVSRTEIRLFENALINANGMPSGGGGGAGGGILLEAPVVAMEANTRLLTNGGPATTDESPDVATSLTRAPSPGGSCTTNLCTKGGDGAAVDGNATDGPLLSITTAPDNSEFVAGSGGGGLGFIRINTETGEFQHSSDTIESGHLTTGLIGTR
jgi:hypothetical protein